MAGKEKLVTRSAETVLKNLKKALGKTTVDDGILNTTIKKHNLTGKLTKTEYNTAVNDAKNEITEFLQRSERNAGSGMIGKRMPGRKRSAPLKTRAEKAAESSTTKAGRTKIEESAATETTAASPEVADFEATYGADYNPGPETQVFTESEAALGEAEAGARRELLEDSGTRASEATRTAPSGSAAPAVNEDKAEKAAEQAAGTTDAATGGGQLAGNNPTPPDPSTDGRFKVGAGWVMGGVIGGAGLTYALMRNRGQQTNAQLYGQQPLY